MNEKSERPRQSKTVREPSDSTSSPQASATTFWSELKRRKVMRVAVVYAIVAWLVIQIAATTFPKLLIPGWAVSLVIMCVILGFPISVVLAWAFELTPDGIKTTKVARVDHPELHKDASVQRKRNWLAYAIGAAAPTVIFSILTIFVYVRSGGEPQISDEDKSIAVLPLENMSPDPENAFFADGVQEDILTNLSKIKELLVISRSSTLQYRNPERNLKQIGEELGVRYLVEGSVRRVATQVLVTAQLIDTQTDGHIWAESYNRELDDIFAIQAEVAKQIAGQLKAALSPEEIEKIDRRPTENQEAYDYYVKARWMPPYWGERGEENIALMEKAILLDPEFAEAWASLAIQYIFRWNLITKGNDPELQVKAHNALKEAERLGPDLPDIPFAKSFFAFLEQHDHETSRRHLMEAMAIDLNFPSARGILGWRCRLMGQLDEAQFHLHAANRIDPFDTRLATRLLVVYVAREMWDKARVLSQNYLGRTDDDKKWRALLASTEYVQNGNRQAYIAAVGTIPGYIDDPDLKARTALADRDFPNALKILEESDTGGSIDLINAGGFSLDLNLNLVASLIWFELENEGKWLIEAEKAKAHFEKKIEDPLVDPVDWSKLTICYALESERDKMESAIAKVRELTSSAYWKYIAQATCETHIAIAYLVLGDHDKAIETLEAASQLESPTFLNRELDLWFIFDRLRGNPRFDPLLYRE